MKPCGSVLIFILIVVFSSNLFAQVSNPVKAIPVRVMEIVEIVGKSPNSTESLASLNEKGVELLRKRCDVDFIDDGVNYWVLRTAGANDLLIREIDKCRTPDRLNAINLRLRSMTESQIDSSQKLLICDLIRFLFRRKDLEGLRGRIAACKEYMRRYENDRFGDRGMDEMLQYIKANLPKMERQIENQESIR